MKSFKFRWYDDDGQPHFQSVSLPDETALLVAFDSLSGEEIYSGDTFFLNGCRGIPQPVSLELSLSLVDIDGQNFWYRGDQFKPLF